MININARSLVNKVAQFEHLLIYHNPDVVIVTETWLRPEIEDFEVIPPAYKIICKDRDARGGGVAIVIKEGIEFVGMADNPVNESVWCRIQLCGASCVIGAVYRPPNAPLSFLDSIQDYLCNTIPANTRVIVAGDFNLPGIQWEKLEIGTTDVRHCETLLDIAFSHDLTQIVTEVTRVGPCTKSILDLVFIDNKITQYDVSVLDGISDHKLVLLFIKQGLQVATKAREKTNYSCQRLS